MDFGKPLRKTKSHVKYETFNCSETQSQRLTADKLPCYIIIITMNTFPILNTFPFESRLKTFCYHLQFLVGIAMKIDNCACFMLLLPYAVCYT